MLRCSGKYAKPDGCDLKVACFLFIIFHNTLLSLLGDFIDSKFHPFQELR